MGAGVLGSVYRSGIKICLLPEQNKTLMADVMTHNKVVACDGKLLGAGTQQEFFFFAGPQVNSQGLPNLRDINKIYHRLLMSLVGWKTIPVRTSKAQVS